MGVHKPMQVDASGNFRKPPPEEVIMVRYDKLIQAIKEIRPAAVVTKDKPGTWWLDRFEELVNDLKENT